MLITSTLLAAAAVALAAGGLALNTAHVPTPQDEASRIEIAATRTANFNGTTYDQGAGFAPGGIGMPAAAVVNQTAVVGTGTYAWVLEESADGATWTAAGAAVAGPTTARAFSVPGFVSQRYVRVRLTVGGTSPSVTYEAWLNANVSMAG